MEALEILGVDLLEEAEVEVVMKVEVNMVGMLEKKMNLCQTILTYEACQKQTQASESFQNPVR